MSTMRTSIAVVSLLLAGLPGAPAAGGEAEALRTGWHEYVATLRAAGAVGIVYLPTALAPDGERVVLDPEGFHVHLVDPDRPGDERVHPAGEPFVPPPGRWRIWLEGEGRISQASGVSIFPPEERSSRGLKTALAEVAPAGRVTPWPVAELPARTELWLLAAGNDPRLFELSRRRPFSLAAEGVPMPAGRTLAAAWDPESERYVALSPPFEVIAGETVPAPLAPPAPGRSGYVAYVEHPTPQERDSHHGVELVVATGQGDFEPDATATTAWGLHAVWSDLPPGPAEVRGGNALLYLPPVPVELAEDAIGDLRETLAPRPLLDVTLVLPREVRERPFWLAVEEAESGRRLAGVQMRRDAGRHRFRDGLEQALVEVVLETHLGRFRRRVDLRAAPEAFVELAPDLIELAGTVTRGGVPHPARLSFQTVAGDLVEAAAGEDGRYRAVTLQPLVWVDVELAGVDLESWRDLLLPPLAAGGRLDVEVPAAEVTVRVVDAATGAPVPGAAVDVRTELSSPLAPAADGARAGRAIGRRHLADAAGEVRLPPRPGRLEIAAEAPGYRAAAAPTVVEVPDPPVDREVVLALDRERRPARPAGR